MQSGDAYVDVGVDDVYVDVDVDDDDVDEDSSRALKLALNLGFRNDTEARDVYSHCNFSVLTSPKGCQLYDVNFSVLTSPLHGLC